MKDSSGVSSEALRLGGHLKCLSIKWNKLAFFEYCQGNTISTDDANSV